ncbi:MAG: hypothetical protein ACPHQT_00765 [Planctomycetota bacterium]
MDPGFKVDTGLTVETPETEGAPDPPVEGFLRSSGVLTGGVTRGVTLGVTRGWS